ncbi:MAG: hypothetical protein OXG72_01770, partial [Acidobacteria bacterium]|nr:hypothetical protein [Acidobacteriota bacterium]
DLAGRIDAIEQNLQKLRRDTGRLSALTIRNHEDLDHALADLDELLYAALATGRELMPGDGRPDTSGAGADPPRCTHPKLDADPPEARPAATHLIALRSPHGESGQPRPPLPRCADCAALALESPSAPRIAVKSIDGGGQPARAPRCQSPAAAGDDRYRHGRRTSRHPLLRRLRRDDEGNALPPPDPLRERADRRAQRRRNRTERRPAIAAAHPPGRAR